MAVAKEGQLLLKDRDEWRVVWVSLQPPNLLVFNHKAENKPIQNFLLSKSKIRKDSKKQFTLISTEDDQKRMSLRSENTAVILGWLEDITPCTNGIVTETVNRRLSRSISSRLFKKADFNDIKEPFLPLVDLRKDLTDVLTAGHFSEYFNVEKNEIVSGTLLDCIQWAIFQCIDTNGENTDARALLLCYRTIETASNLFDQVAEFWRSLQKDGFSPAYRESGMKLRIFNFLWQWIKEWREDIDKELLRKLIHFAHTYLGEEQSKRLIYAYNLPIFEEAEKKIAESAPVSPIMSPVSTPRRSPTGSPEPSTPHQSPPSNKNIRNSGEMIANDLDLTFATVEQLEEMALGGNDSSESIRRTVSSPKIASSSATQNHPTNSLPKSTSVNTLPSLKKGTPANTKGSRTLSQSDKHWNIGSFNSKSATSSRRSSRSSSRSKIGFESEEEKISTAKDIPFLPRKSFTTLLKPDHASLNEETITRTLSTPPVMLQHDIQPEIENFGFSSGKSLLRTKSSTNVPNYPQITVSNEPNANSALLARSVSVNSATVQLFLSDPEQAQTKHISTPPRPHSKNNLQLNLPSNLGSFNQRPQTARHSSRRMSSVTGFSPRSLDGDLLLGLKPDSNFASTFGKQTDTAPMDPKMWMKFPSRMIAIHLTAIEWNLFKEVSPLDMLEGTSVSVSKMIERFNLLAGWVATEILKTYVPKDQAMRMVRFLQVAQKCFGMRNYNTTSAIVAGLSHISITRLKKLREYLSPKYTQKLSAFQEIFSPLNNYKKYRSLNLEAPFVPFMAVVQKDIVFIKDGNKTWINEDQKIINVSKWNLLSLAIASLGLRSAQQKPYELITFPSVLAFLTDLPVDDEEILYSKSTECEPPAQPIVEDVQPEEKVSYIMVDGLQIRQKAKKTRND